MELGSSLPHSQESTTCPYPSQINPFLCPSHFWQEQLVSFLVGLRTYQHPGTSFSFQYHLVSFRPSITCLNIRPRIPIISVLPSILPSIPCFRKHFLRKMWAIQLVAFVLLCVGCSFLPSLSLTLLQFLHDLSNWSSSLFPSTIFQNFFKYFCLFPKVSNIQHHKKLSTNCKMLVVSSSKLIPICWWRAFFFLNALVG